jgi:hypothetical protein
VSLTVRVSADGLDALRMLAERQGVTVSDLARRMLAEGVARAATGD